MGVTQDQARQGYGVIGEALPTTQQLSSIYGEQLGQGDLEDEFLGGSGLASQKRKLLAQREAGQFAGSAGTSQKSLGSKSRGEYSRDGSAEPNDSDSQVQDYSPESACGGWSADPG